MTKISLDLVNSIKTLFIDVCLGLGDVTKLSKRLALLVAVQTQFHNLTRGGGRSLQGSVLEKPVLRAVPEVTPVRKDGVITSTI